MTTDSAASSTVEIRKYPNRRYYDRARSRHLTLEDIRTLICKGADVRIVDSQTDQDITSKVLTQIILEFDSPKLDLLTAPLLTQMIRVNDQVMKGFFERFFHQALASFFSFQQQMEQQLRKGQILPSLFPVLNPWYRADADQNQHDAPSKLHPGASEADAAALADTVRKLQSEIKSLRRELKQTPSSRKRK